MATAGIEPFWNFHLLELDGIRSGESNRFGNTMLFDKPTDDRAALAVDARLDARIIANRDEARLNRTDRTVSKFADENVAIVDIHAHKAAGRAHHPLRHEIAHRADDAGEISADPPVANIDNRCSVALERRRLQQRLIRRRIDLA